MRKLIGSCMVAWGVVALTLPLMAQQSQDDLYELSLEELVNISIVSASKEEERLFDAPVAAYRITREEISRAGAWSIPEALRLVPGVIVRETSNGNYDIHLRGFDNTPKYSGGTNQMNNLTLVMINNRPVFNYNIGSTSWDALPVDLADVDRIEVVIGPSAPLFGPNAVTGVINIITRSFDQQKLLVSGQLQGTMPLGSYGGSLAVGKQLTEKLNLGITGNYQQNARLDDQTYVYVNPMTGAPAFYMNTNEFVKAMSDNEVDPETSLLRKGVNAYASYKANENISFDFSSGLQKAESQKVLLASYTPLTFAETSSYYANLNAKIHKLSLRTSYLKGEDDLDRLSEIYSSAYNFQVMDVAADYELQLHEKFRLRPSIGYQSTRYEDKEQAAAYFFGGSLNGDHKMNNLSGSLRADFIPVKGLRLIASGRLDKFDVNDGLFLSYQFASTYAPIDKLTLRAVHARSYSGIFYINAFSNARIPLNESGSVMLDAVPNKEVDPAHNTVTELGARAQLLKNLQLDVTLFAQRLEDVSMHMVAGMRQEGEVTYFVNKPANLNYYATQRGFTAAVNWIAGKQWQIRPFVTLQTTKLHNFDYQDKLAKTGMPYEGKTIKHQSTPAVFGGWYINYAPISRLNLNTSAYFFGKQLMSNMQDYPEQHAEGNIGSKMLLNARASYQIYDKLSLFIGGKNLLNNNAREYYGTDRMGSQYYAGLGFNL